MEQKDELFNRMALVFIYHSHNSIKSCFSRFRSGSLSSPVLPFQKTTTGSKHTRKYRNSLYAYGSKN